MIPGVSVIVCCYNSAGRLPQTLKHLALQKVPASIPWEVIVIDNASTDDTFNVACHELAKYGPSIDHQLLKQPVPGKNYAFKTGAEQAKYQYLLTCDDDNRLNDNYVVTAFEIMQADPAIGVLGGCGIFDPEQPTWTEIEKFKSSYVNGLQTWAATEHWVYGAGSICCRNVLIDLYSKGWPQIITGKAGNNKIAAAEDVELCFLYFLTGYKIVGDGRLLFKHYVPVKRQNKAYLLNMFFRQSYSYVLLSSYLLLIDQDKRTVQQKIDDTFINALKASILLIIKLMRQKLNLHRAGFNQKLQLQTYRGTLLSVIQNRKKIIGHNRQLNDFFKKQSTGNATSNRS